MATIEETKKMIEVMQAYVDGKEIEATYGFGDEKWYDEDSPDWDWCSHVYRIKKNEPKSKPKFKVGDYVRILNGREIENYRHGWTDGMSQYVGYIFRVRDVREENGIFYYIPDVRPYYSYDERGLELVEINKQ